jgi:hypothetical protein
MSALLIGSAVIIPLGLGPYTVAMLQEPDWNPYTVQSNKAAGNTIVEAIEKYKAANGRYPPDLDALVPDFLPQIEPPPVGRVWHYEPDGQRFHLICFSRNGAALLSYSSSVGKWTHVVQGVGQ